MSTILSLADSTGSKTTAFSLSAFTGQKAYVEGQYYENLGTSSANVEKYGVDIAYKIRSYFAGVAVPAESKPTAIGALAGWFTTKTAIGGILADIGGDIQKAGLGIGESASDRITSEMTGEKPVLPKDTGLVGKFWQYLIYIGLALVALFLFLKFY
jgi:hypothetical protein